MKKVNTSPISGAAEFTPAVQAIFDQYKNAIEEKYHLHGFQTVETPVIERTEILLAKAGGDTEKQIYKVVKTAEASDAADQALRFDHTVPLARYVIEHENDLAFPFRVAQIGKSFRGERAQKGRFRELYQCDVDIIGRNELPLAYDAEVIAAIYDALQSMNLPRVMIRISNRHVFNGFLAGIGITDQTTISEVSNIIDHAEKVPAEKTTEALESLGLTDEAVVKITTFMHITGDADAARVQLESFGIENEEFARGIDELTTVLKLLEAQGLKGIAVADLLIIRGLDYYTGTVFEAILPEYRHIGSISGGGRYDNLTGYFSDNKFPGVGGSIGLSRLFYVLQENNLAKSMNDKNLVDIVLAPISENEFVASAELADQLRSKNYSVDVDFTAKRLGDKLTRAAKIANFGIVIGGDEVTNNSYKIKNFVSGEVMPLDEFLQR